MSTQQLPNAAMKETTPDSDCCPNCGWSETDEQIFYQSVLEHQQNLPDPSLWRKIFRRIDAGPVLLSDFWYFSSIQFLFSAFISTLKYYGVVVDFSLFDHLLFSFFVVGIAIISRFFYRKISYWIFRLRFENDLS